MKRRFVFYNFFYIIEKNIFNLVYSLTKSYLQKYSTLIKYSH